MIPGYLGSNIQGVLHPEDKKRLNGNWDELPKSVTTYGTTPDEIFAGYHDVEKKVGKEEMKHIPLGAIAFWTLADKLGGGLQQLMAGARKFDMDGISRNDIFSANRETEKETAVSFITAILDESAKKILCS